MTLLYVILKDVLRLNLHFTIWCSHVFIAHRIIFRSCISVSRRCEQFGVYEIARPKMYDRKI